MTSIKLVLQFDQKYSSAAEAFSFFIFLQILQLQYFKRSLRRCSVSKGVLRNFEKFIRKHLCQSLFFNKVAGLTLSTLLKQRLWHGCFPVNFTKFLRTSFLQNTSGRLLLIFVAPAWSLPTGIRNFFWKLGQETCSFPEKLEKASLNFTWNIRGLEIRSQLFSKFRKVQIIPHYLVKKQPPKVSCKKRCSQKFRKFHRNFQHLQWSLFLIKWQACKPATLSKRYSNSVVFLWNLWNI